MRNKIWPITTLFGLKRPTKVSTPTEWKQALVLPVNIKKTEQLKALVPILGYGKLTTLNKGECFYLVFTTDASTNLKTYKVNFDTNGTGYETSGSVYFFGTNGTTSTIGNELNVKSEGIYFVKVTKTADSEPGKECVDFYISKG